MNSKFLSGLLCSVVLLTAQLTLGDSISDSLLHVGDHVPQNIRLRLLHYNKKSAPLSEFRSKLLILDFWNTYCGACYKAFPKIEAIQKHFSEQMKILLVTDQTDSMVLKYFGLRKKAGAFVPVSPIVYHERRLEELFDHSIEPHEVWIDETGEVIQITSDEAVTMENIQCVLGKRECIIPQKNDIAEKYDGSEPLFKNGNGGDGKELIYHSVISHHIEGLGGIGGYHSVLNKPYGADLFGILAINLPIIGLYQMAYDTDNFDPMGFGQFGLSRNRVIFDLKDSSKYTGYINGVMKNENLYCYDLVIPNTTREELKKMMRSDLDRFFGLKASLEKRTRKCLVLKIADTSLISTDGRDSTFYDFEDFSIYCHKTPINKLLAWLTCRYIYPYPIINETGIKGSIDMKFEGDISNYEAVASAIKKYKMEFVVEDRDIDVLVLKD